MTTPQTLQPPAATQADQLPVNFTKELRIIDPLQGRSDYNLWAAMTKKAA
jgi:hypothetical protein